MKKNPWIMVKFGKSEYLKDLQNGLLYMNSIKYFKNIENLEQKDIFEGTDKWFNPDVSEIIVDQRQFKKNNGTLSASLSSEHNKEKLFCISVICKYDEIRKDYKIFDDRMKIFGDSFLIIYNLSQFFDRVNMGLQRDINNGKINDYRSDTVKYVDLDKYDGDYGLFVKPKEYNHQKEWRILVNANTTEEYKLYIDNISDISHFEKIEKFKNRIEKKPDGDGYNLIFC
jgi:hypothetical protein